MVSRSLLNHVDHCILHTGKALYGMFWNVHKLGISGTMFRFSWGASIVILVLPKNFRLKIFSLLACGSKSTKHSDKGSFVCCALYSLYSLYFGPFGLLVVALL